MQKLLVPLLALASIHSANAQEAGWHAKTLGEALMNSALFGLVGVVMLLIGFKIFDKAVVHLDLEKEIQKGNVAAAILGAAVLIAIAMLLAVAMS
jgi:putative membrane protein